MNEIFFRKTSNIFLNVGIIGLYIYLEKYKTKYECELYLEKDYLKVKSDNLLELLEDVYYEMGKDYYDTSNKKQLEEKGNAYFIEKEDRFVRFPKMYSYGLAGLLTNNIAGKTKLKENTKRIKNLQKEGDSNKFINKFREYFDKEGLKLEQQIYFNEPYTKLTRLDFDGKYLENGVSRCSLTGEKYAKLVEYTCTSPLLSGLNNFESFGEGKARQISWKASYLSKFSPVICLYMYIDGLDKIACYFFNSDNLVNTYRLYKKYAEIFLDKNELIDVNYNKNFRLYSFENQRKSEDKKEDYNSEFIWQSEILFVLLYTYYRKFLFNQTIDKQEDSKFSLPKLLNEIPIHLTYFRADSFTKTMRPYLFEEFNNYKFIMGLFSEIERKGWDSKKIWNWLMSLKIIKESDKSSQDRLKLERNKRKLRNEILDKILKIDSILVDIKKLFYASYNELISGTFRYRNYKILIEFTEFYEQIIKHGGNEKMNEEIQAKAIKLGSSIGMSMINFDTAFKKSERETNIKNGRKYIVSLNKSRTLHQFLSEIKRIQVKYGTIVNEDLLKHLDEENWEYVKNFCIISALNKINIELLPEKLKEGDEKSDGKE